jgi:hypothetical protein
MVCIRAEKAASDPAAGSIEIVREGQWLVAPNSTLGADNGIGIAAAMSIAESEDAPHGPLELLFTVEEETTGKGADGLDPSLIQAKVMVNLDAETSGVLDIGSAGSKWVGLRWPAPRNRFLGVGSLWILPSQDFVVATLAWRLAGAASMVSRASFGRSGEFQETSPSGSAR